MRILVVHNASRSGLPSGEETVFRAEVEGLRAAGHAAQSWRAEFSGDDGWKAWRQANVFWSRRSFQAMQAQIRRHRPELVHFHGVLPDLTVSAFEACRRASIPVVHTLHNYRWFCVEGGLFRNGRPCEECLTHSAWRGVLHRCCRRSLVASALMTVSNQTGSRRQRLEQLVRKFIAVSPFVKARYEVAGFEAARIEVKYNGVTVPDVIATRLQRSPQSVLFAGRMDVAKGTSILSELPRLLPQARFVFYGRGPEEARLRHLLGDVTNVYWGGQVSPEEVRQAVSQAMCVVVPSRVPESFGLVAATALAQGTPVVAASAGGLGELVAASQGGTVIPSNAESRGYADAIQGVLENETRWEAYSTEGHAFARRELEMGQNIQSLVRIYETVLR